jgi:hypothetical protein
MIEQAGKKEKNAFQYKRVDASDIVVTGRDYLFNDAD